MFKIYRHARVGFAASHFQCLTIDATGHGRLLYTLPNYPHHSQLCKCTGCPHSLGVTPTTMNPRAEPCWKTNPAKSPPTPGRQGVAFPPDTTRRMRRLCATPSNAPTATPCLKYQQLAPPLHAPLLRDSCGRRARTSRNTVGTQSKRSTPPSRQTSRTCAKKSEVISE